MRFRIFALLTCVLIFAGSSFAVNWAAEPALEVLTPPAAPSGAMLGMAGVPTACIPPVGGHCVDTFWTASPTAGVTYNIFRSSTANACVTGSLVGSGSSATTFTDMNVTNGASYNYAMQAQNSGGKSACTLDVQVQIPTPPQPASNPGATVQ